MSGNTRSKAKAKMTQKTPFLVAKRKAGEPLEEDEFAVKKQRWRLLEQQHEKLEADNQQLMGENDNLTTELEASNSENGALTSQVDKLRMALIKHAGAKGLKFLQDDELVKDIILWYRQIPFRNNKFFLNKKALDHWVKACWNHFKGPKKLDKAPHNLTFQIFKLYYTKVVIEAQSKARQYVQSEAQKAAKGKSCLVLRSIGVLLPLMETNLTLTWLPLSFPSVVP